MPPRRSPALLLPPVAVTLFAWAALSAWMLPRPANDLSVFLVPWFDHIAATGAVAAFARPFSDYTPAYLYLLAAATPLHGILPSAIAVKLVSLGGTVALALAFRRLLRRLGAPQLDRAAAVLLLLPTVELNAGLLGQCDAIWSAAAVMALVAALDRRHAAMLGWFGLALGFKLQALLLGPLMVALLIERRMSWRLWGIAPAATAATMLPAWLAGWPASDLATIWLHQAGSYARLSSRAPNLWSIAQDLPWLGALPLTGLAIALTIGATAAFIAWFSARPLHRRGVIDAALLCVLVTAGLAPRMHERYFFLADVLALGLALALGGRTQWRIALLVQAGSMLALLSYRSAFEGAAALGAIPMLLATALLVRRTVARAKADNPRMARTA